MSIEYIGYSIVWSKLEQLECPEDGLTIEQFSQLFGSYLENAKADVDWYSQSLVMAFNMAYDVIREELQPDERLTCDRYYGKFHWRGPDDESSGIATEVDSSIAEEVANPVYLDLKLDNWQRWETNCVGGLYSPQSVRELNELASKIDFEKIKELISKFYPNPESWPVSNSPSSKCSKEDSIPNVELFAKPKMLEHFNSFNCFFSADEAYEGATRMVDAISAASDAESGFFITLSY